MPKFYPLSTVTANDAVPYIKVISRKSIYVSKGARLALGDATHVQIEVSGDGKYIRLSPGKPGGVSVRSLGNDSQRVNRAQNGSKMGLSVSIVNNLEPGYWMRNTDGFYQLDPTVTTKPQ